MVKWHLNETHNTDRTTFHTDVIDVIFNRCSRSNRCVSTKCKRNNICISKQCYDIRVVCAGGGNEGQESEGPVTKQGYSKARLHLTTGLVTNNNSDSNNIN